MTDLLKRVHRFVRELRRRNVYRVAAAYLAVAFVGLQAARLLVPPTTLPTWGDDLLIALAVFGFPVAVVVAWAFELTPDGVRRTSRGNRSLAGSREEPGAGERSIAVLPFSELGPEEPGTFTEGMHDALLTRLSNIEGLMVISRTSVQQYRETDRTTAEIARELGVRWIVEGGVQEMGSQIQVNAQLIDPRTDSHGWAESYRRDLTADGLFDVQGEITRKIVRSLETELTPAEEKRVDRQPTGDLGAYRSYIKGRMQLERRDANGMRKAVRYFERAVEDDPSYALAYCGIADAYTLLAGYYARPPSEVIPRAEEAARDALSIEPDQGEARASLGLMKVMYDRDFEEAERQFDRAVRLNPGYATAHHWYGMHFLALGRLEEAFSRLERAEELDPRSAIIVSQVGLPLAFGRDHEAAAAKYREAVELDAEFAPAHSWLGIARAEQNRYPEAIASCQRAVDLSGQFPTRWIGNLAYAHAAAGEKDEARRLLRQLRGRADAEDEEYVSPRLFVPALAELGDTGEALRWLERACDERSYFLSLKTDPRFDSLRGEPRFEDVLARMGVA